MDNLEIGHGVMLSDFKDVLDTPRQVWIDARASFYEPGWGTLDLEDVPEVIKWLQAWLAEHDPREETSASPGISTSR